MADAVKVSVIVPVYGVERQLARCVDSLIAQTYPNIEILLVDDGSVDRSGEICDEYAKNDARVRVFHKENGGVSSARNLGLENITGDYVLFLDGDDSLAFETIETCVKIAEDEKFDVVCFGYRLYLEDADGGVSFLKDDAKSPRNLSKKEMTENFSGCYRDGLFDFVTDKLFKTSLVKKSGAKFESYFDMGGEDALFVLALLPEINSMAVLPDCFYNYYRRAGESVTVTFKEGKFDRYYERVLRIYNFMRKFDCLDKRFLSELYCTYALWFYESLFSGTCKLSNGERRKILRKVYEKPEIYDGFSDDIKTYAKENSFDDYSSGSRRAIKFIAAKKYRLLSMLFSLTAMKNGR